MSVKLNEDKEIVKVIKEGLKQKGGYCPCRMEKKKSTSVYARSSGSKLPTLTL